MRLLHTADWHLGDRLGRMDRTEDLRRAVERVAAYCDSEKVDVLLVAGDLFSELAGPDGLREAIAHLQHTFEGFLSAGGTILTITGNHDKESFCQTLRHAMSLAAPLVGRFGERAQPGRFYLVTNPTLLRLPDRSTKKEVQFVLMPYPTPARYLHDEASQRYQSLEEKNKQLLTAYTATMQRIQQDERFDARLPSVLSAHVAVRGAQLPTLFRLSEEEDVVVNEDVLPDGFAYVALGHIHRAQAVGGRAHIRYSGSIERMDLGESHDDKSITIVDIGPKGLMAEPRVLPLDATPIYDVVLSDPQTQLPLLPERYPEHARALVRIECTYTAGIDNREEILQAIEEVFPRWYDRQILERNALGGTLTAGEPSRGRSFEETVRGYLDQELTNHPDEVRAAVMARAEDLMREVQQ
jgi:exonuclease SbcD